MTLHRVLVEDNLGKELAIVFKFTKKHILFNVKFVILINS